MGQRVDISYEQHKGVPTSLLLGETEVFRECRRGRYR